MALSLASFEPASDSIRAPSSQHHFENHPYNFPKVNISTHFSLNERCNQSETRQMVSKAPPSGHIFFTRIEKSDDTLVKSPSRRKLK